MATYDVSTVASQIQPPQATSLGDMLNIARGAQAYQQAQQVNPLIAQQQQTATEQAQFNLAQVKADKVKGLANSLLASQNWSDPAKMDHEFEFVERVAKSQGLDVTSPNNPLELIKKEYKDQGPEAAYKKLYQMTYGAQTPSTQFEAAGKVIAPSFPGAAQQANVAPEATSAPKGVTADQMNQPPKSEISTPVKLSYPVRQAGQAYAALPQEEEERGVGTKTKSLLFARQADIPQSQRTIDRVIEKARDLEKSATLPTSGILGAAERGFSTFLGTEQGIKYKELSKDLANAQIANIVASGGSLNTDAGKQLVAMANGDVTYPPKILIEIAQRTKADMAALDSKAVAIKKFADKFGDQNISAFNQMWSKNADPDIFQLKNIFESDMSDAEKAKAREKIIGNNPAKAKLFMEKWNNIKKLEQTGTL